MFPIPVFAERLRLFDRPQKSPASAELNRRYQVRTGGTGITLSFEGTTDGN